MYPEAGGSSLFARQAFNEFWSFFAAWAQMLNYVITIAISAFFVAHYLGGLSWSHCSTSPGDIVFGVVADRAAGAGQRARRQGRGERQRRARRHRLHDPAALVMAGVVPRLSARRSSSTTSSCRDRADVEGLPHRDPDRHDRLHGHRDDLEHGRGGQGRGQDDPRLDQPGDDRRVRHLLHAPVRRAVGAAGPAATPTGQLHHAARPDRGGRRLRRRPDPRHRQAHRPRLRSRRRPSSTSASWPRRSSFVADQRRHHRRLAARVLDGHPPPDARRAAPAAPAATARRGSGILVFSALACVALLPGQADFLGSIYAFGAMLSFTIAHLAVIRLRRSSPTSPRPYRGPGNLRIRGYDAAAVRHPRRGRHGSRSA